MGPHPPMPMCSTWKPRRGPLALVGLYILAAGSPPSKNLSGVSHPWFFFISILSLGSAKDRPITDTDVQSDGRPLSLPGDSHGALHVRDAVAAARKMENPRMRHAGDMKI
eukprot:scaffold28342_cov123-Isochrysis_galbana.AAC.1